MSGCIAADWAGFGFHGQQQNPTRLGLSFEAA
jgi:hypothetical protein